MNKIYEQAKDLHVVGTYAYSDGGEFIRSDAECTQYFEKGELKEAFNKGEVILVLEDKILKAISCDDTHISFHDGSEIISLWTYMPETIPPSGSA